MDTDKPLIWITTSKKVISRFHERLLNSDPFGYSLIVCFQITIYYLLSMTSTPPKMKNLYCPKLTLLWAKRCEALCYCFKIISNHHKATPDLPWKLFLRRIGTHALMASAQHSSLRGHWNWKTHHMSTSIMTVNFLKDLHGLIQHKILNFQPSMEKCKQKLNTNLSVIQKQLPQPCRLTYDTLVRPLVEFLVFTLSPRGCWSCFETKAWLVEGYHSLNFE